MRADVNLSVRPMGATEFGTRTEMKNINSFKAIERAIAFESARQIEAIEKGEKIVQETRRWDDNKGKTFAIGDYYNDIYMLKAADISACPSESPEDIKESVDFVGCACRDGAVADFIEYLKTANL